MRGPGPAQRRPAGLLAPGASGDRCDVSPPGAPQHDVSSVRWAAERRRSTSESKMAAKRGDPMMHVETRSLGRRSLSSNVRRLHDHLNVSLDEAERQEFVQALNDYHYKRNVYDLVYNLRILLDTPEKRQLFSLLRKVIPKSDQALFDMHTSEAFLSKAPGIHRAASMPVASGRPLSRGSVELLNRPVSTISEPEMATTRKPPATATEPELKTKTYKKRMSRRTLRRTPYKTCVRS
ncbi:hypothetical protein Bbelb_308320 [Branchiostoma belcheri]|nr:hypothetical protein Bbelb_308320 [Branchiostoma belcheri]